MNIPSDTHQWGVEDSFYRYDSIGNMTYKSDVGLMEYGEGPNPQGGNFRPHAVTSLIGPAGTVSISYDANGNMLSKGSTQYTYDIENRLTQVTSSSSTTQFFYDGDGGRLKKLTVDTGEWTVYIGSIYEVDSEGIATKHIFAGSNRLCSLKSEGTALYYHTDHLGSSNVLTDGGGSKLAQYEYSPYGKTSKQTGTDLATHKFTGKQLDETGLYYYGARYYDPELGRFISADTIVQAPYDPQSLNRYAYARNNPVKYVDPNGRWFWVALIVGAILGGASAAVNDQPIWKGVLMGALGGALVGAGAAGFGFWGAVTGGMFAGASNSAVFGGNIGIGALTGAIGAGIGFGLGSWASGWNSGSFWGELGAAAFAGSMAGGVGSELSGGKFGEGAWMGAAYASAGFMASRAVGSMDPHISKARRYEQEVKARHALNAKKNDMIKVEVSSRSVGRGPAGHRVGNNWEMGPNPRGKINTSTTVEDLSSWGTNQNTQDAIKAGTLRTATVEVSASGLVDAIALYEQYWVGESYSLISYNSNYAVNTVIYAAGGSVPGGLGWTPAFGTTPSSVFYPYTYQGN